MIVALASALALVFGVAVAGKISPAGFGEFRLGVGRLWFGPGRLAPAARNLLALAVLGAEVLGTAALAVGAALAVLLHPQWLVPGFAVAAALLATFTTAHAVTLARGRPVPCACFGRRETPVGPLTLFRTALLLVLAVAGLAPALTATGVADPAVALLAVPAGLALGLLLVSLEDLVALFRPTAPPTRPGTGA
ncbi:MAG TPA: MauE/DoxX family redox-associated membrane protein [Pseudonocardia sp.]|nr:MauE/DoxX family redox-associated membrane protein [Pseudonocardia sp.]